MIYHGIPNWPPVWTRRGGDGSVKGEIGVLKYVYGNDRVSNKCFLVIEHENTTYVGCLIFNDHSFCAELSKLLRDQVGRPIQDIGSLDLGRTL